MIPQPPALGRMKCNIHAAFFAQTNHIGIGICLRDDSGMFGLAKATSLVVSIRLT